MTRLSRRRFLQMAGLAATAWSPLLGACGRPDDDRLRFLNWQDYIDPQILRDFESAENAVVTYSTYASNDELADRLVLAGVARRRGRAAETVDLIVPSDNLVRRLLEEERLARLDDGVVTPSLLSQLDPKVREVATDPGNRFTVPWATGTTGIGYDRTVFATPPDWSVFADPKFAGRLSLLDERREAFAAALFSLGKDPNTTAAADVGAAAERLGSMLASSRLDSAGYLDGLASGQLVAAQAFSTDVLQAQIENPKLAFVIPEEGGVRWVDFLCIPSDAPNPKLANRFIANYLDPAVSARNIVQNLADTANTAARALVPAEIQGNPVVFPDPATLAALPFLRDLGDDEQLYLDAWDKIKGS